MTSRRPAAWLALLIACSMAISSIPVSAQTFASSSSDAASAGFDIINDVFIGRGSTGPYMLTWRNIEPKSDIVIISGRKLTRDQEYSVDYASGIIAFQEPLASSTTARVTYHKVPSKAAKNGGSMVMPLNTRLASGEKGNIDLMGSYKSADGKTGAPGLTVFGLSGDRKFSDTSNLSSMFLFSQDPSKKNGNADFLDQAALKLGTNSTIGKFNLTGSLIRTGQKFSAAKDYNLQSAKELLDLAGVYGKATEPIFASFTYKENDDLVATKGVKQTNSASNVVLNLENMPTISYTHAGTQNQAADGKTSGTAIDTFKADQKFGKDTSASASFQKNTAAANGKSNEVNTTNVAVQSNALKNMQLRASLLQTDTAQAGTDTGINFGLKFTPNKTTILDATQQIQDSDKNGHQTTTALKLTASPNSRMQLVSNLNLKSSDRTGNDTGYDITLNAAASKKTNVQASFAATDSDKNGQTSRTGVTVATTALNKVQLRSNLSQSTSSKAGTDTSYDFSMAATPNKKLNMQASYGAVDSDKNGQSTRTAFGFDVSPMNKVLLKSSLVQTTSRGGNATNADFAMSAANKTTSFTASHSMANSDAAGDRTKTTVGILSNPFKTVQFTGNAAWAGSNRGPGENSMDLMVKANPNKTTSLEASRSSKVSQAAGELTKTAVKLGLTAFRFVQLQSNLLMDSSSKTGDTGKVDFALKAVPDKRFNFDAGFQSITDPKLGQADHAQVKIAASPLDVVQFVSSLVWNDTVKGTDTGMDVSMKAKLGTLASLEGSYAGKQANNVLIEQQQALRLAATPINYIKMVAGVGQKTVGFLNQTNSMDANIELSPSDRLKLATGYSQSITGAAISAVRNYSGTMKPLAFLQFGGAYKDRYVTGTDAPDTAAFNMSVGNARRVKLTAQYAMNPEDAKGIIKPIESTSLGLDMRLGVVGISGGFTQSSEYLLAKLTRETNLGLKMPIFGHGNLSTSFKLAQAIAASQQSTYTYSVGYTHIVSGSFNLSLAGEMTQYQLNAMTLKDEYKATAKLGMTW